MFVPQNLKTLMMTTLNDLGLLVSVGEACAVLWGNDTAGNRIRIYRMIENKKIKAERFGKRKFFIQKSEIERIAGLSDSSTA